MMQASSPPRGEKCKQLANSDQGVAYPGGIGHHRRKCCFMKKRLFAEILFPRKFQDINFHEGPFFFFLNHTQTLWNLRSRSFLKILVSKGGCWDPTIHPTPSEGLLWSRIWCMWPMTCFGANGTALGHRGRWELETGQIELNLRAREQFLHT